MEEIQAEISSLNKIKQFFSRKLNTFQNLYLLYLTLVTFKSQWLNPRTYFLLTLCCDVANVSFLGHSLLDRNSFYLVTLPMSNPSFPGYRQERQKRRMWKSAGAIGERRHKRNVSYFHSYAFDQNCHMLLTCLQGKLEYVLFLCSQKEGIG